MAEDFGLVCKICVDSDFGEASTGDEPLLGRSISRLLIQDLIVGGNITGWLRRIQPVDRRHQISILPARREIGVKVRRRWLKEQPSIDGAGSADGATNERVHLVATGQIGRAGKDGIVESRYVHTA